MKTLIDDRAFVFIGVLAIAAAAREAGHAVEVLDLTGHSRRCPLKNHGEACAKQTLEESCRGVAALAQRVDVIGFYSMAALHCFVSKFLAPAKEANPSVVCVLGGPHASTAPDRCIAEGWDYVVISDQGGGGGEPGFLEVLEFVKWKRRQRGSGPKRLPLAPTGDGPCGSSPAARDGIVKVPSRDPKAVDGRFDYSNDRWPLPARDLIDFDDYRYELDGRRFASIVTQAGCVYRCSFCAHSEGYTKLVLRSPEHVRAEIQVLVRSYPWVGGIMIYDDEVNIRPDLEKLLDMLGDESRRHDLVFRGFFKSGKKYMTRALFERFYDAGFRHLCTGAESAHPDVLRLVGKGATLEDNTDFVRLCSEVGIKAKVFTQIGLPGETAETAEANRQWIMRMARDYGLSDFDVTITTPTSGTPLYETPEKFKGLISFDKAELDSNAQACNYKGIPGEYKSFVETRGVHGEKGLTRSEIVEWRQYIEDSGRHAANLPALVGGKDDG